MVLNEKRNRCSGPGGGTRHLHQDYGGETASTRIVKAFSYIRYGNRRYRAKKINANDNFAPVAMAA